MKKTGKLYLAGLFIWMICVVTGISAAATDRNTFQVIPLLTDNQREGIKGYFDLLAEPGQTLTLSVEIANDEEEEIVAEIEAITASTNLNGVINYTTPGIYHESIPVLLSDLIKIEEPEVVILAHSKEIVTVQVKVPDEAYEGYLLGALHIKRQLSEEELNSGQTILNQYSYAVAVKLAVDEKKAENEFLLEDINAELINGRASIVHQIVNPQPILVKGMNTEVKIFPKNSDIPVMERVMTNTEMAPNSVFPFSLIDDAGNGIKAGTYKSVIEVEYNDQVWNFEQEFEIKEEEAAGINKEAVNLVNNTPGLPLWAIVVLVIGGAALILAIICLICLYRTRNKSSK